MKHFPSFFFPPYWNLIHLQNLPFAIKRGVMHEKMKDILKEV